MRRNDLRLLAGWRLIAVAYGLGAGAVAAGEPEGRIAAIVAALRVEEARFADVEYVARTTTRRDVPNDPAGTTEVSSIRTRRVVLQWDRISFHADAFYRAGEAKVRREETSAYDGERTVTVIAGNCVNIHLGRFEHPDVEPPHGLPLQINVPLSVYLSGTEAIHAHPRYPRFNRESGTAQEIPRVEVHFEGEEELDGLRCLKVRVDRWQYSNNSPARHHLWLAPGRNYHCIKEEVSRPKTATGDVPTREMHVDQLREVAPGIWFPVKITAVNYDIQALRRMKKVVTHRTETVVDKVDLAPRHDDAFFRGATIPAGLPVFTIRDRALVGSALPEPAGGDGEPAKRAEVIARVAAEGERYDDLEVKARVSDRALRQVFAVGGAVGEDVREEHSIIRGRLGYFASRRTTTAGGPQSEQLQVIASDGRWIRSTGRVETDGQPAQSWVMLGRADAGEAAGRRNAIPLHRPHALWKRIEGIGGPLADWLDVRLPERGGNSRIQLHPCGEAKIDGHPCIKLRCDSKTPGRDRPHRSWVLYLAADRNCIPIRVESYGGNDGYHATPGAITGCDDLREIAPGVWYPFRVTELIFDDWVAAAQGWIVLNTRRDTEILSATLSPRVDEAVFRGVTAPAGTTVHVFDEERRFVGRHLQSEDGIPTLTRAGYLKLLSQAPVPAVEQPARRKALDALAGRPAPEFPAKADWLDGRPMTWKALRGRVVILAFWAEWSEPCRDDLARLVRLHQDRAKNGLTIIGIHPPGSEPAAIKKAIDACHLDFPICVAVEPPDGVRAWGDLFGRFAVRAIPHAVAVDAEGKVAACGRLEDVIAKARVLVEKGR